MKEGNLDIVKVIIENMPEETDIQMQIKLYLQMHKTRCNEYVYTYFEKNATMFNVAFRELRADLGREVLEVIKKRRD